MVNLNSSASSVKFEIIPYDSDSPMPTGIDGKNQIEFKNLSSGRNEVMLRFENLDGLFQHKYRLRQVNLGISGWTYDKTEYIFTLYVIADDRDNVDSMIKVRKVDENGNPKVDQNGNLSDEYKIAFAEFTNTYHSVYIPNNGNGETPKNPDGDKDKPSDNDDPGEDGDNDPHISEEKVEENLFEKISKAILPQTGDISKILLYVPVVLSFIAVFLILYSKRKD